MVFVGGAVADWAVMLLCLGGAVGFVGAREIVDAVGVAYEEQAIGSTSTATGEKDAPLFVVIR